MTTMNIDLTNEQKNIYDNEIAPYITRVNNLSIKTDSDNLECQNMIKGIKQARARIYKFFHEPVMKAHEAWQSAKKIENFFVKPYDEMEETLKGKSCKFVEEQERIAREKADRAEAERRDRERREREKLEQKAVDADEKGNTEKAETLRQQAENVYVPPKEVITSPTSVAKGTIYRDVWIGDVTNKMDLLRSIIDGRIPHTVIEIDQAMLNKQADLFKDTVIIPGVRFRSEKRMIARK